MSRSSARMRLGRTMPRRSSSVDWAGSGWSMQSRRISPWIAVGRMTSCDWMRELFEDGARGVAEARALLPHLEALLQHEGQEADEDVSQRAIFAQRHIATSG
jgi:hypothetical protein